MMGIAKVTTNFQVTIPKDVRRIHDVKVGDTVLFAIEGNKVDFVKMTKEDVIKEVAGRWKDEKKGTDFVKGIRKGWSNRMKRLGI